MEDGGICQCNKCPSAPRMEGTRREYIMAKIMDTIPFGMLADFLQWNIPTNLPQISPEVLLASQQQLQQLLVQQLLPPIEPFPTVTPPPSATSSPVSTSSSADSVSAISPPISDQENKEEGVEPQQKKKRKSPQTLSKNYSDCEKKHFLDVAYENNWGTTVAANKFNRIWGKGPTRRMFYWWRGQFKKDRDREDKILEELYLKRSEGTQKLQEYCNNPDLLKDTENAADAQKCHQELEANDKEIENVLNKKKPTVCSITGEKCAHGNGIQEDTVARKFTTSFICEHCQMPFQKESTRHIHQILCANRCINPIQLSAADCRAMETVQTVGTPPPPPPATVIPIAPIPTTTTVLPTVPILDGYNTKLTELAEQLIASLAACVPSGNLVPTTVISN